MKYSELLQNLQGLTDEQLAQDVTVFDYNNDETFAVEGTAIAGAVVDEASPTGVLDDGHFYLFFNAAER